MNLQVLAYLLTLIGQPATVDSPSGRCEAVVVAPARAKLLTLDCVPGLALAPSLFVGESEESESDHIKLDGATVRWEPYQ